MPEPDGDITELLVAARGGDGEAIDRLFTLVYDELHRIAHGQRRHAQSRDTLGTTAVVHEAYIKLVRSHGQSPNDRGHFFAVAATAMRQILVDYARRRRAEKRGADPSKESFDESRFEGAGGAEASAEEVLAVDEVLGRLEELNPRLSRLVELRFFGGLSLAEAAAAMGVVERTAARDWLKARAFLFQALRSGNAAG
jgi:RNA polymerase sigma factor (TIGR02999 family)